ncbi:minor tail protein [Arthrobacter phage Adat]|uniref:Minor tail protein n=2 Tax=Jasminevirus adat TaxID=2560299 RepID=A0A249XLI0_9CAUD|nr:hypothetical protein FDI47_gp05 [Arthrobacter phage Adat]ASZ72578.1 minor tail protein [Arthrobacter phage Adat]AXH43694.1 minor tail protein [Arthrobacter phage Brad]
MPTPTPNLLLQKAAAGENYDLELTNQNLDKIDDAVGNRLKLDEPFGHIGRTAGFQTIGGTDVGVICTEIEIAGGMVFESASAGRLMVPKAGKYLCVGKVYATGSSAVGCGGGPYLNAVKVQRGFINFWKGDTNDFSTSFATTLDLNANDRIGLGMTFSGSTWGTDGGNGSYLQLYYIGKQT